uniref:Uncharacterized protein n=1 Tax=Romanomermis culicivorax TaxID=13658 RepID=A0A915KPN0_ROMCU
MAFFSFSSPERLSTSKFANFLSSKSRIIAFKMANSAIKLLPEPVGAVKIKSFFSVVGDNKINFKHSNCQGRHFNLHYNAIEYLTTQYKT